MSRKFSMATILSVTGKLVTENVSDVYDILNYMTGENLYTHQLPRAALICEPALLKQHPQLATADSSEVNPGNWRQWLASKIAVFGEELEVEPLPEGAFAHIDPIKEAEMMMGDPNKVIVIKVDKTVE